jgi:two-component system, OmpR family, response regulator
LVEVGVVMRSTTKETPALWSRRLLVVTPDAELRDEVSGRLAAAGSAVASAGTGGTATALLDEQHFDLAIVDLDIPDLADLADRRPSLTDRPPVLCVTTCEALFRVIPEVGTEVDDYVTKPCRMTELLARAQVVLRAREAGAASGLRYHDLVVDDSAYRASRGSRVLDVTPAEYRLLRHLLINAGQVLSKEQLARQVWGESRGDNAMERLVSRLRQKVDRTGPSLIHTRRGFGYWLGDPADDL